MLTTKLILLSTEMKRSAMSDSQWSTALRPLDLRAEATGSQLKDPKMTVTAPHPGVSDMSVDTSYNVTLQFNT